MLAEGKIRSFASTVATEGSGFFPAPLNPKSKIENSKLETDPDPIYSYDLNGNRVSMIDPTGLTTYTYDALNRLTSIMNNKGQVTSFIYDALGRRTSMTHANGVATSYTYDAASQLLTLAHQLGATTINSFNYTYDKVGNRKSKADNNGAANYTYDTLNRLVEAVRKQIKGRGRESFIDIHQADCAFAAEAPGSSCAESRKNIKGDANSS